MLLNQFLGPLAIGGNVQRFADEPARGSVEERTRSAKDRRGAPRSRGESRIAELLTEHS